MKKLTVLLLGLIPVISFAQRDWDAIEIKTIPVSSSISYLEGSGGNIGVLHGEDGILIIDDQFAELSEKIKAALSEINPGPLKYIANTHYHGDHTGGNENLSAGGVPIVAHENVRTRLSSSWFNAGRDTQVEPKPEGFWPTITFNAGLSLYMNDEEIQVIHLPKAHTDGDVIYFFRTSNVMHTGDAFVRYGYPYIDVSAGGSIDGFIKGLDTIIDQADANTKIIPGHGALATRADVIDLRTILRDIRTIVADLKGSGKSLDDCLTEKPLAKYESMTGFIDSDSFIRFVYETIE